MGKPSAPPAPDYVGAAKQQGVENKETAIANTSLGNPNVFSPYGNQTVTYDQSGPAGNYQPTITQTLTPQAQQTLDAQQRVQTGLANLGEQGIGQVRNVMGTPFDASGVPKNPINPGMTAQAAILDRLNPQLKQNREAQQQRLANQGIPVGSEAWNNEMRQQGQNENDLYTQAALQGIGLDTQAHQAGLQEAMGLYNQPLNQVTALMSGSQIQTPQFQNYQGSQAQAAPLYQAAQNQAQAAQQAYAQQMAGYNSMLGGLGMLGGAALGGPFGAAAGKSLFGG